MLRFFGCAMTFALVSLIWAATPATSKKAVKKSTGKTSGKTTTKTAAKKTAATKAPVRKATTWRNRQMAPTQARYRQIQEALASKGYLQAEEATGSWTQTSADALKKFQTEQNITSTGKINSLSLIALGLGPKRDPLVKPPAPPAAQ